MISTLRAILFFSFLYFFHLTVFFLSVNSNHPSLASIKKDKTGTYANRKCSPLLCMQIRKYSCCGFLLLFIPCSEAYNSQPQTSIAAMLMQALKAYHTRQHRRELRRSLPYSESQIAYRRIRAAPYR